MILLVLILSLAQPATDWLHEGALYCESIVPIFEPNVHHYEGCYLNAARRAIVIRTRGSESAPVTTFYFPSNLFKPLYTLCDDTYQRDFRTGCGE